MIQEKAIPAGIAGRDVLGSAQTGTGKTCAFGVPILQRLAQGGRGENDPGPDSHPPPGSWPFRLTRTSTPTARTCPLTEAVIFGGVGQAPRWTSSSGGWTFSPPPPGRLADLYGQGLLNLSRLEIFVLDEADRMLDMGFIHDVRKVIRLLPQKKQTLFFSATMPRRF